MLSWLLLLLLLLLDDEDAKMSARLTEGHIARAAEKVQPREGHWSLLLDLAVVLEYVLDLLCL